MKSSSKHFPVSPGFTLLEMMVTIGVLSLMMAMMGQMAGMTSSTIISSRKHMDADSQARLIFDRMANDFARMVRRPDVDCIFHKNVALGTSAINDSMFFYSEAPAYANVSGNQSTVSLVGYRINPATFQLERLGEALTWDAASSNDATASTSNTEPGSMVSLTYPTGGGVPLAESLLDGNWSKTLGTATKDYTNGADSDYHVLGEQAYRLEINFLLIDGTISTKPVADVLTNGKDQNEMDATQPPSASDCYPTRVNGSRWYDTTTGRGYICTNCAVGAAVWAPIGTRDIVAISVALAILDNKSRTIIANPATALPSMANALPDAVAGHEIDETWGSNNYWIQPGIPNAAAQQIRIYQRYFYLNNR